MEITINTLKQYWVSRLWGKIYFVLYRRERTIISPKSKIQIAGRYQTYLLQITPSHISTHRGYKNIKRIDNSEKKNKIIGMVALCSYISESSIFSRTTILYSILLVLYYFVIIMYICHK